MAALEPNFHWWFSFVPTTDFVICSTVLHSSVALGDVNVNVVMPNGLKKMKAAIDFGKDEICLPMNEDTEVFKIEYTMGLQWKETDHLLLFILPPTLPNATVTKGVTPVLWVRQAKIQMASHQFSICMNNLMVTVMCPSLTHLTPERIAELVVFPLSQMRRAIYSSIIARR